MLERLQKSGLSGTFLDEELNKIVSHFVARALPEAIILFGSAANDAMTAASDIDLLVVYPDDESAERARKLVLSAGPVSQWPVDLLFVGKESFEEKSRLGGVYAKAKVGRILFSKEKKSPHDS